MIAGVCAGLGEYFGIDPTIVRLLFLLAFFTGFGGIAIVYLIMALVVPEQSHVQPQ
jgi:phage shock protein PspC (stress-responsive transcriptional regulator)